MANRKKKTVIEEVAKEENAVEEIIEEIPTEEVVEENIAEEAEKEEIIESDEGKNEDSSDEGEPEEINEDIIVEDEPEIIQIVEIPTENDTTVYQEVRPEDKGICKVVLATPSYYIINKNGSNVTIYGKNDKKRGDTVEY